MRDGRSREEAFLRLVSGESRGPAAAVGRGGLWLLSALYGLGVGAYRGMYDVRWLPARRLPVPVVSIGNLTVGGTGKTGLTLSLARLALDHGLRPVVLSYGYRSSAGKGVVSDGSAVRMTAAEAGDEAAMLARELPGVPVLIGKDRVASGEIAIERYRPDLLILDDGFQDRPLARDVDLVLMDALRPWGLNALLPRGLLRETPAVLRRASAVLLTRPHRAAGRAIDRLDRDVRRLAPGIPVYTASYLPTGVRLIGSETAGPVAELAGMRVAAMTALGNPGDFEESLVRASAREVVPYRFPDHHAFRSEEVAAVSADAARRGLDAIVTTAKDAVKIEALAEMLLGPPIRVLEAEFRVAPEREFEAWLLDRIARTRGGG